MYIDDYSNRKYVDLKRGSYKNICVQRSVFVVCIKQSH